jgi:hypothetical protein
MTDESISKEPEPEHQIFYRGYVLKATQNRKSRTWTLSYRLRDYPPIESKLEWQKYEEAFDHGKRMVDFSLGT